MMISSTSARKRAESVYEESFANPQFEQGRKKVPQAELEHVSPEPRQPQYPEQQAVTTVESVKLQSIRMNVAEHLQKISECLNQINNLTSEIQMEKENIKRILQDLHI